MIGSDYVLEALNIYHSTEVDAGGCFSGGGTSALVLKGVHLTLHSGEVMAILGSKGSGKRALLDVISRRAEGTTRGQVLLNGSTLTKKMFQQRCGYVTHSCDFIPGLNVSQTLHYTPTILSGYLKSSKVRQVLADLALSQVANKKVEYLNISEKRRLAIGVQLVRDPVMLLLDEPTYGLDPLSAYLLISILSNSAKKTGCGILLSLEKPRSDVFPFLDRALFLCLGGAVYSGGTRAMLEYFHNIGFPCPQLENPLMYYLCLSTVDRRSRDRFLESSQQIEALVERFSRENFADGPTSGIIGKVPLAYGKPGEHKVWGILYLRLLASTFSCGYTGFKTLALRLLFLPASLGLLWLLYSQIENTQSEFYSKNTLILNILAMSYGSGLLVTSVLFPTCRKRFIQEHYEGLYSGLSMLIAYDMVSIPFSCISAVIGASLMYPLFLDPQQPNILYFTYIFLAIWTSFILAEQLIITFMFTIKSRISVSTAASFILIVCLILSTGTVRSHKGLLPWLQDNAKSMHQYYASVLLHHVAFLSKKFDCIPIPGTTACTSASDFMLDRLGKINVDENTTIAVAVAFAASLTLFNIFLYLIPTPRFVKEKFKS